jgi:limonene-1,2-epoxide hydrolase
MIELSLGSSAMTTDPTAATLEFLRQWEPGFDAMAASFADALADEGVWDQRPIASTAGPDEAIAFLRRAQRLLGLERIVVDVLHVAATSGGVVLTHRVDHLLDRRGRTIVSAPVAGAMTWQDGRITHWRELFDAATFGGAAARGRLMAALRR